MKDIVIIGAGGIGREVAWIIEEINKAKSTWNIVGFVDDNSEMWRKELNGYKVLGGLDILDKLESKPEVIVAIANCGVKKEIVSSLNGKFDFATVIYPSVRVSKYIEIGEGTIIYPGVSLTVNTRIGNHVVISGNCGIGHDSVIGDFSSVLWGSCFSGFDVVGEECFIGVGTKVAQGVRVADGRRICTGGIITEDII
ncbi:transferase [Clostridium sp.]|uniref:PglD-related sugar-binding protein n=1 Tax=Clostridium sp. TaxID=1506 RepID=UPI0026164D20|nr:transferase [Clostridium sp.]